MKRPGSRVVPTLTEVLQAPRGAKPREPAAPTDPSDDELRQLVAAAVERAVDELREQLRPRVETLVREALAKRPRPVQPGD